MSNDRIDEERDLDLVTHDDLPESGDVDPLDDIDANTDEDLLEDAADTLIDEDVASEDLSANDLINDGVPIEDIEPANMGRRAMDNDFAHPQEEDTIDERMRQEIPEEGSAIVAPTGTQPRES